MRLKNIYKALISLLLPVLFIIPVSCMLSSCTLFGKVIKGPGISEEAEDPVSKDSMDEGIAKEEDENKDSEDEAFEKLPVKIWIEDMIPEEIKSILIDRINSDPGLEIVQNSSDGEAFLEIVPTGGITDGSATYKDMNIFYIMAPSTFFYNMTDEIEWEDLKAWWSGDKESLAYISEDGTPVIMALEEREYNILAKILGETVNESIQVMDGADIVDGFSEGSITISITAFNRIDKRVKVLGLSGMSVFDRGLDYNDYPLAFSIMLHGKDEAVVEEILSSMNNIEMTNRDMSKFTSLIMTGVTAMARSKEIGKKMDELGVLYPAEKIIDTLKSADITHISNEIPFVEGCPGKGWPIFCSDPDYMELLRYVETDVIELTGNHMNDYGHEWMLYTLKMYEDEGWPYFGGGKNLEDCYNPAILESNGHKFAFLGLNSYGPKYAWATEDSPGCAPGPKEEDFEKYEEIIKGLKNQGYIVVFTFQYEEYPQYYPGNQQIIDFRRMIDAGADIVSGSQSHYPMGAEIYNDGFINYGLGNLFFNMKDILGLKQGIIAKHIFYDGKHISTILITTMLEDYSQPRLTTQEERTLILESIFAASIK